MNLSQFIFVFFAQKLVIQNGKDKHNAISAYVFQEYGHASEQ